MRYLRWKAKKQLGGCANMWVRGMIKGGFCGLVAGVLFAIFGGTDPTFAATPATCSPDQGGKYVYFLQRIHVPGDVTSYGTCNDHGFSQTHTYAGATSLPDAYWVYAEPYWYLWAERASDRVQGDAQNCSISQGNKYSSLVHKLYVPGDVDDYGHCYDYGYWPNTSYAGFSGLSPGYWVYVYPDWYVWLNSRE